ncbi:TPA: hypothetical protein ACX6NV_000578 [Photobacterium damselae]
MEKLHTATFTVKKGSLADNPNLKPSVTCVIEHKTQSGAKDIAICEKFPLLNPGADLEDYKGPKMGSATQEQYHDYLAAEELLKQTDVEDMITQSGMDLVKNALFSHGQLPDLCDPNNPDSFIDRVTGAIEEAEKELDDGYFILYSELASDISKLDVLATLYSRPVVRDMVFNALGFKEVANEEETHTKAQTIDAGINVQAQAEPINESTVTTELGSQTKKPKETVRNFETCLYLEPVKNHAVWLELYSNEEHGFLVISRLSINGSIVHSGSGWFEDKKQALGNGWNVAIRLIQDNKVVEQEIATSLIKAIGNRPEDYSNIQCDLDSISEAIDRHLSSREIPSLTVSKEQPVTITSQSEVTIKEDNLTDDKSIVGVDNPQSDNSVPVNSNSDSDGGLDEVFYMVAPINGHIIFFGVSRNDTGHYDYDIGVRAKNDVMTDGGVVAHDKMHEALIFAQKEALDLADLLVDQLPEHDAALDKCKIHLENIAFNNFDVKLFSSSREEVESLFTAEYSETPPTEDKAVVNGPDNVEKAKASTVSIIEEAKSIADEIWPTQKDETLWQAISKHLDPTTVNAIAKAAQIRKVPINELLNTAIIRECMITVSEDKLWVEAS